jgi:PAS domain S-box-containing protein
MHRQAGLAGCLAALLFSFSPQREKLEHTFQTFSSYIGDHMQTTDLDPDADPARRVDEVGREGGGEGEQARQGLELYKIELELKNEELRRAQAELETLRGAQRQTSEILESIADPFYAVDADWRLTYVNKKTEVLWGRPQEDLVGRVLWSLFPKPEETKGYDEHLRAMAERMPVRFETFSPNLHFWVSVNIYPTADGGLAVYFRDITERKQAEEALRESKERLQAALDASGGAIYDHRVPLDETTYHDERWAEMLGYRHAELPAYDRFLDWLFEQVHPEDRELLERAYDDFVESRVPGYDVEIRLRHKQGHWVWVQGYSHAVERDESGRVRRIVGMMSDITERKQAEAEREQLLADLAAERQRLDAVLRQLPVGAIIAEAPSGNLILGNEQADRIWGHEFIASGSVDEYAAYKGFHADGRPCLPQEWPLARSIASGEVVEGEEIRFQRGDGSFGWMAVSSAPIRDAGDHILAGVATFTDITERKRLEEALATERESLELRVRERTEALLRVNEELRHEIAERAKAEAALLRSERLAVAGKLAAGLAHEIKNPLQSIMGCAQLADEELPADEKAATYMRMIIQEARRISALVDELRDLQRPAQEEDRQSVSVNEVVERQLGLNSLRASEQGVEVEWQPAGDLPPVWGLRRRLQQVFLNLLLNAFDVMPKGGQLHVRSQADQEGKGVWLHIADSGPGIPEDVLPYIFEPFYSTREEGQGLGLFICHNIIAEHDGRIQVDSRLGEGTTFSVWLPAVQAE